jgi:GR25 family glycosyltransferase involved in LPS biosynthesis
MKTFTITLFDHDKSKELSEKSIKSSLDHGYDAKVFKAHSGEEAVEYLKSEGVFPISNTSYPYFDLYNNWTKVSGTIGCFASHYNLWKICVDLDEPIIVLEHDAIIKASWNNPEWNDVLHLDWEGTLRRRGMRGTADYYAPVVENSVYRMSFSPQETSGTFSMNCTYSYAIKPDAALKLIQDAQNNGWFASDRFMREPLIEIYTINPKLAEEQPEAIEMFTTSF